MMVLQIYVTDDEIKTFFEANGFRVEEREFGRWGKQTHGTPQYERRMQMAVLTGDRFTEARPLFERIAEKRMKRYLLPQSLEAKRGIENELKNLLNN